MIFRPANLTQDQYTRIPNRLLRGGTSASELRSDGISPESLGVLVYLLSHVDEWQITNNQLCTVFGVGNAKMSRITEELETSDYIRRKVVRNESGHVVRWDWLVTDVKGNFPLDHQNPDQVNPDQVNPDQDNQTQRTTISKNKQEKEQICWRTSILNGSPEGIANKPWSKWWEYKLEKRKGRKPAAKMITSQTEDFKVMKRQGFDISGVVDFAISRDWERIGDPDWKALKSFKGHSRKNDLLGLVK
jgi:hypothetical protein|tara:strand:- start:411 stop:1148 length:738 start_codon:yes stop_codon:yes gene_type:complete